MPSSARPDPPKGAIPALFVLAACLFWFFGPLSDGPPELPTPELQPLRVEVLGDVQMYRSDGQPGWPTVARNVLSRRLDRRVILDVVDAPTAASVEAHLMGLTDAPDLIVVAVGWEDGEPGDAIPTAVPEGPIAKLATRTAMPDRAGFFVRTEGPSRTHPIDFLTRLETARRAGASHGSTVVFVQQLAQVNGELHRTAAAGPGPRLLLTDLLTEQSRAEWWSTADALPMTDAGHRRVGGLIGEALAPFVR